MNTSKLIGGIICLVIAAGLTVANLALPEENIMFMVGAVNMPWVPPIVLVIVGIVLLATANQSGEKKESENMATNIDPEKSALNKRMETVAWGAFLIMLGGFMFVPEEIIKGGWWSIGVGLIFLCLNAARYFNGLRMSGFTTFLGIISVVGGVFDLVSTKDIDGAVFLIVLGGYLILKPWFDKQGLFGKAEAS